MRLASASTRLVAFLAVLFGAGCIPPAGGAPGAANIAPRAEGARRPASAPVADEAEPPTGRLPTDVRPLRYRLRMRIVPARERFRGSARIRVRLTRPRTVIWMHGESLDVTSMTVRTADGRRLEATWDPVGGDGAHGLAAVRLPEPVGPGEITLAVRWRAAFDERLLGLYRVRVGQEAYAFTQFESTYARGAFPCFDEPAFKTPFAVTLEVPREDVALGNTPVVDRRPLEGGLVRVRLAPTKPLPTYLVAWAVGPLDVVEAKPIPSNAVRDRPIPLRGVAVRGEGAKLARALAETPAIVESLERYVGRAYPFAKLDLVAVPDFAAGAMENPGLVTFRDTFLLLGDDPPEWQKRAFTEVTAHELAHQWFGDLVTMPWWDDVWLNEAFATWLGTRTAAEVAPASHARLSLLESVHHAMATDSLAAARRIHEPVASYDDIENAFDAITYEKGAAVLGMFEHWLGKGVFRKGLDAYLAAHAFGTATTNDLLAALAAASGKDVAAPFHSFLDQVGVPFVSVTASCTDEGTKLTLSQRRYLPVGSTASHDQRWQVPVCVRAGMGPGRVDDYCFLLADGEQDVLLEDARCADWVMPNADAAGYYRFALAGPALDTLLGKGWSMLSAREKLALADSLEAAFRANALGVKPVFATFDELVRSDVRPVAEAPMGLIELTKERLVPDAKRARVVRMGRRLYAPAWRRLGWDAREGESGEDRLLRASVLRFLALDMENPAIRAQAKRRAERYLGWGAERVIHPEAVGADLVGTVLVVAVQDGDPALFDYLHQTVFQVADPLLRARVLNAIGHARRPDLAARARDLTLDGRLRVNETLTPLRAQMSMPETRDAAWQWLTEHFDEVVARVSDKRSGDLPWLGSSFCSDADAEKVRSFFEPRVGALPGGQRNLAQALAVIHQCAALVDAHGSEARKYF